MWEKQSFVWFHFLVIVIAVSGQSDSQCPANSAMGLCTEVPQPCYSDADCMNGDMCCPEACSRTCKPRNAKLTFTETSIPDLLNDPRVYIGKCPDASCYSMFGGEPNECSTSKLCPEGQSCCNDGCRNVCQWKPEFAALIAQQQARARQRQRLIVQRQQDEIKRKQQEMYVQQQRQRAAADLARKRQDARAAAEAELRAQQVRLKYEADLKSFAEAKAKATQRQQQQAMIQQGYPNSMEQPATSQFATVNGSPSVNTGLESITSLNSNRGTSARTDKQPDPQFPQPLVAPVQGQVSNVKKDNNLSGSRMNQIQSPANVNPYSLLSQQNVFSKVAQDNFMSLLESTQAASSSTSLPKVNRSTSAQSSSLAQKLYNAFRNLKSAPNFPRQDGLLANGDQARRIENTFPASVPNSGIFVETPKATSNSQNYPIQNQSPQFTSQRAPPLYPFQNFDNQSPSVNAYSQMNAYSPANQYSASSSYRHQSRPESVSPFLMYQAMQSVV